MDMIALGQLLINLFTYFVGLIIGYRIGYRAYKNKSDKGRKE